MQKLLLLRVHITAALLACVSIFAEAQTKTLSWQDCVDLAIARNPDFASSSLALQSSRYSYYGSFNGVLPSLTLSNSYADASTFGSASNKWSAQASANMNVFSLTQINNIRTSKASLNLAEATLRQISSNVRQNLRNAFSQVLFAQENVLVSKNILTMRQRSAQMLQLRYDAGQESKGNMMRSKAQALQAEVGVEQALRDLRSAQKTLARQLGLDDFKIVGATGTLAVDAVPSAAPDNFEPYLGRRPDVAVQEATVQSAKVSVSQAWSPAFPSLSVNYTRSVSDRKEFPNSVYNWSFLGQLSYAFFGGGPAATYFAIASAKKNLEKAQQDLRTVRGAAVADLESTYASFVGAAEQVRVQLALLAAARQRNEEADVRYASGLMSYDNWEIIASDRISQERQAIIAQLSAAQSEASWKHSLGLGLGE